MITLTFYASETEDHRFSVESITGFKSLGHAGFSESGSDIVCAAVSVLVMNTMNSIESFTSDRFVYDENEKKGMVDFKIVSSVSPESALLLRSLLLGVKSVQEEYGERYLRIEFKNS